jgi:hypothetical protein
MRRFEQGQIRHNSLRSACGSYSVFPLLFAASFRRAVSMGFLVKTAPVRGRFDRNTPGFYLYRRVIATLRSTDSGVAAIITYAQVSQVGSCSVAGASLGLSEPTIGVELELQSLCCASKFQMKSYSGQ